MSDKELPEIVKPYPEPERQPFDVAMLIDNIVYQVLNIDGQTAAQYLSQPTYVRIKDGEAKNGWKYNPEALVYHELAHLFLKRSHKNERLNGHCLSIMSQLDDPVYDNGDLLNRRDYYINELFNKNTPLPEWINR